MGKSLSAFVFSLGLVGVGLFFLTGCSGLLPQLAGTPPVLYELQAPSERDFAAIADIQELPVLDAQVLIDIPESSAGIDTPRIALVRRNQTIAYIRNVSWTDRAPVMFQTLLVDSFDRTGRLPAVGRENMGLRSDYLIKGELSSLQADYSLSAEDVPDDGYADEARPVAVVSLKLKLVTMPRRVIVASRSFESRVPAAEDSMGAIVDAFQKATDSILQEATAWTLNRISDKE